MGYTALYRKFRPDNFEDVKGQDHIVKTLKNQLNADRMGHAYLFCGTRGTGKTSIAKIFARAVNCEHPVDGSPCNECPTCKAILAGSSMNVIEIDAASNNGVDNIREIREEVAYSPAQGKYKVYIIDEVHMLSIGAFNALLKTLEEPPSYVIFILATTEAHKIPVTILSRCQRYDFRRISQETILERLKELLAVEQIEAEEKALRYIAKKGDGAMRDSLSLLDQCIAFYMDEVLTYDKVLEVLGAVDTDVYSRFLRMILKEDLVNIIAALEELIMQGRDLTQFVSDFTWYLRNLMLIKASDDMEDVLDVSSENLVQLQEEAGLIRNDTLMRYIRIFSELSGNIRYATNKRVLLEMALIKLCKPETEKDELSVMERLRKVEAKMESVGEAIASGAVMRTVQTSQNMGRAQQPADDGYMTDDEFFGAVGMQGYSYQEANDMPPVQIPAGVPTPAVNYGYPVAAAEDLQRAKAEWKNIVNETRGMMKVTLQQHAEPKFNSQDPGDKKLYIVFDTFLGERYTTSSECKQEIEQIIADRLGRYVEVKLILKADEHAQKGRLSTIQVDERIHDSVNFTVEETDDSDFEGGF